MQKRKSSSSRRGTHTTLEQSPDQYILGTSAIPIWGAIGELKGVFPITTARERERFAVREVARLMSRKGWDVRAQLSGYDPISRLEGVRVRPDLVATKGEETRIVEVVASNSAINLGRVAKLQEYAERTGTTLLVIDASPDAFGSMPSWDDDAIISDTSADPIVKAVLNYNDPLVVSHD